MRKPFVHAFAFAAFVALFLIPSFAMADIAPMPEDKPAETKNNDDDACSVNSMNRNASTLSMFGIVALLALGSAGLVRVIGKKSA